MVPRGCRCRTAPADALDLSRPCAHHRHLLVSDRHAGVIAASHAAARTTRLGGAPMKPAGAFPALLEAFFVDRLMRQRQVSRHTLASYRDTFRLLLEHAQEQLGKVPSALTLADLDAPFVGRAPRRVTARTCWFRASPASASRGSSRRWRSGCTTSRISAYATSAQL